MQRVLWIAFHRRSGKHSRIFNTDKNPAKDFIKSNGQKVKRRLLFDQQIISQKHGMRPMPNLRGARYENNAKRIASFGLTGVKISTKRYGGARVWVEYAFCQLKTYF